MKYRLKFLAVMISMTSIHSAMAAIMVNVGDHSLFPDTAGQNIEIIVSNSNSDNIAGMNFLAELVGSTGNPLISGIDFDSESGLLFFGNSDGYSSSFSNGTVEQGNITVATPNTEVLASGIIKVAIDTTGITESEGWLFRLTNVLDNPANTSAFFDRDASAVNATFIDGTITVIPEPSLIALILILAIGTARQRLRII